MIIVIGYFVILEPKIRDIRFKTDCVYLKWYNQERISKGAKDTSHLPQIKLFEIYNVQEYQYWKIS